MIRAAELVRAIEAGTRLIVLQTSEEHRAVELLEDVAARSGQPLHTWSLASGVDAEGSPRALASVLQAAATGLWALLDPAPALADPLVARALREAASKHQGPTWIVVEPADSTSWAVPPEAWQLTLPTPDRDTFEATLAEIGQALEDRIPGAHDMFEDHGPAIARALLGLGMPSAERLVAEAVLAEGIDPVRLVEFITRHKPALIPTEGLLEPAQVVSTDTLGGYGAFKAWMKTRALALLPEAEASGILPPRGVLLLGVQGCGKSLAARSCADTLGLPLLRLDPGRLFGGTVGRSEANLRQVLTSLDAMAPVVLWVDEIDKGFAGGTGRSDAGTSARVMGGLLTWLAERARPVFVVATANDVQGLPPELLRRGRLDEIFFFDLPGPCAREDILRIHLEDEPRRRLGLVPPMTESWPAFASIAAAAEGFSGAELQAAVTEARLHAFAAGRPLSPNDLRQAVGDTVPLSVTRAESIQALRAWAVHRTRPAAM
ncbi:MAG: AAA family ATPase [Nannocystales bacterium]